MDIAITLNQFSLLKPSIGSPIEVFTDLKHNEPYIVTAAMAENGSTAITTSTTTFPGTVPGDVVRMLGSGHLIYQGDPGKWIRVLVSVYESDSDVRQLGDAVAFAVDKVKPIASMVPGSYGYAGTMLVAFMDAIKNRLSRNGDDHLFSTSGTFMKDRPIPFSVGRSIERGNDYASVSLSVNMVNEYGGLTPTYLNKPQPETMEIK